MNNKFEPIAINSTLLNLDNLANVIITQFSLLRAHDTDWFERDIFYNDIKDVSFESILKSILDIDIVDAFKSSSNFKSGIGFPLISYSYRLHFDLDL